MLINCLPLNGTGRSRRYYIPQHSAKENFAWALKYVGHNILAVHALISRVEERIFHVVRKMFRGIELRGERFNSQGILVFLMQIWVA